MGMGMVWLGSQDSARNAHKDVAPGTQKAIILQNSNTHKDTHCSTMLECTQSLSRFSKTRMHTKPFIVLRNSNAHEDVYVIHSIERLLGLMEIPCVRTGLLFIIKPSPLFPSIQSTFQDDNAHSSWPYKYRLYARHYSPFLSRPFFT